MEDDNRKQAHCLFQQAEQEYRSNDIVKAQELAERSNAIFPSSDAKKMLAEIEAKHQRQKRREEVLKSVPPEVFAQVLERKREEQKSVLMKFGIRKLSTIAKDAAFEAAIDEVIKISSTFPANAPAR